MGGDLKIELVMNMLEFGGGQLLGLRNRRMSGTKTIIAEGARANRLKNLITALVSTYTARMIHRIPMMMSLKTLC